MPDKKYHELSKRLDAKSKKKRQESFRSYERIRQDMRGEEQRRAGSGKASSERTGGSKASSKAQKEIMKGLTVMALPFIAAIILVIIVIYALTNKNAMEITVNDEVIAHCKTKTLTKEEFLQHLEAKIEELEDTEIMITDTIELTPVHGKSKYIMDDNQILNLMTDVVSYKVLAAKITVNGQPVGIAKNQDEADRIFNSIMSQYMPNDENITAVFLEDVEATGTYVSKSEIDDSDTIRAELSKTSTSGIEYEVVGGDTLSTIAARNGITVNDIKEQNPELDVTKPLQIGQKLYFTTTTPFVSVMTTETKVETVDIQMPVDEQPDSSLETGKRAIKQQGSPGVKEITTQIIRVNGAITSTSEPVERIVEPAVTQIVSVGTG